VPLFSSTLARDGVAQARAFAEQSLAVLIGVLLLLVAAGEWAMPAVMDVMAPGFRADPGKFELAVALTRITFPYLLFISLASLMGGVLNGLERFAAVAATPILLNLTLLVAALGFARGSSVGAYAMAWGLAAAGVVQFLWLTVECHRAGMPLRLPLPRWSTGLRQLVRRVGPGAFGAGVVQINLLVGNAIASFLPTGAVSFLFYADRLNQLPLGVIGIAIGTAVLPLLSRQVARGELEAANHSQNRALEAGLLLTLPAAAALVILAEPIIRVLFERGAFDAASTRATAAALAAYAVGLPAYVLVKVLAPAWFARGDTRTPLRCAIWAMLANVALSLVLVWPLAHVGLALATAVASWINTLQLGVGLARRGHWRIDVRLRRRIWRIALATIAMGAGLWFALAPLSPWLHGAWPNRFGALLLLVAGGGLFFLAASQAIGAADWREFLKSLRRPAAAAVEPPPIGV
jgi:putative peptidoglycan lipid II flippase